MAKSTNRKRYPSKKDYNQIDKNENNINKQLAEIRHSKHKNYLQSKSLERNKNVAVIGDSIQSGLKEELLPNKKHQTKVRYCRGATIEDMFDYVKLILKRKPNYVVLQVGGNNVKDMTSRKILDKLIQLKTAVLDPDENCKFILSQPMTRVDDYKACLTISKLNDLQEKLNIPIIKNRISLWIIQEVQVFI